MHTYIQTSIHPSILTYRQTGIQQTYHTYITTYIHSHIQRHTDIHTERHTGRQADRQTCGLTD